MKNSKARNYSKLALAAAVCLSGQFAGAVGSKPPAQCASQCDGTKAIAPFNYKGAITNSKTDPVTGKPLGPTITMPVDENSSQTEQVPTSEYANSLQEFENYTASQCGESLGGSSPKIEISSACSNKILDRKEYVAVSKHKPTGSQLPSVAAINTYFEQAAGKANQDKLKKQVYWSNDMMEINSNKCLSNNVELGSKDTLGLFVTTSTCRYLYFPKMPSVYRIGLPETSQLSTKSDFDVSGYIFSFPVKILAVNATATGNMSGVPSASNKVVRMGAVIDGFNLSGEKIAQDKQYKLADYTYANEMSVPVGPLEFTVEIGASGFLRVDTLTRSTRMWVNTDVYPHARIDVWVAGSIGIWIARAGAEGKLNLVDEQMHNYAFAGVAAIPTQMNGGVVELFNFSEQLVSYNVLSGLGGELNAFAKIRVPKFIGLKWKKYSVNLYRWDGMSMKGYLYDLQRGPIASNKLYNSFLAGDSKTP